MGVFMSVYRNSIQKHVKKGKCPKPFGQNCSNCGQVLSVTVNSTYDQ